MKTTFLAKTQWWFVAGILLLGGCLRLVRLDQSLWLDEAINVMAVKTNTLQTLIFQYPIGDFHPPLYHALLFWWTALFGYSEVAVRFPSLLFGLGTIVVLFLLGRTLWNAQTGLTAALLLAVSGLHIYYSQEARMYAQAAFFAALSMYFFVRLWQERSQFSARLGVGYGLATLLLLYSEYVPYLLVLTQQIAVLWYRSQFSRKWLLVWWSIALVVLLGMIPWWQVFSEQLRVGLQAASQTPAWGQVVGAASVKSLFLVPVKFVIGRISLDDKTLYGLAVSVALLFFAISITKTLRDWTKSQLLWWWLVGPVIAGFAVSFVVPIFSYFRFLFVLPAFYLLAARGVLLMPPKKAAVMVTGLLFISSISTTFYLTTPRFWRENWQEAAVYLKNEGGKEKSAVVFVTDYQMSPYQYYGAPLDYYGPIGWQNRSYQTVFLIRYVQPIFDPQDLVKVSVEHQGFMKVDERDFNGVTIWKYQKRRE